MGRKSEEGGEGREGMEGREGEGREGREGRGGREGGDGGSGREMVGGKGRGRGRGREGEGMGGSGRNGQNGKKWSKLNKTGQIEGGGRAGRVVVVDGGRRFLKKRWAKSVGRGKTCTAESDRSERASERARDADS